MTPLKVIVSGAALLLAVAAAAAAQEAPPVPAAPEAAEPSATWGPPAGGLVARPAAPAADKDDRVRGTAVSMLGKMNNRSPAVMGALVRALDMPGETVRQRACASLSEWTGQKRPYDPAADQPTRDRTIAAWKDWRRKQSSK